MFSSPQQLIKLLVIILIIAGLGVGGYFLISNSSQNQSPSKEPAPTSPPSPQIRQLTQARVLSPALSPDGRLLYYRQVDGHIFSLNPSTNAITEISGVDLENLQKSTWGPNARQVISEFLQPGGRRQVFYYSFEERRAVELPAQIQNVAFNPAGSQIAYQFLDSSSGVNVLSVADPQNRHFRKLTNLESRHPIIFWLGDRVAYVTESSGIKPGSLFLLDPQTGERQTLQIGIFGLTAQPAPSGTKILYTQGSQTAPNQVRLFLQNLSRNEIIDLNLHTLPAKCTWNPGETVLYCAVPKNIPASAVLPDHWRSGDFNSQDQIWKIDLNQLKGTQLTTALPYDISWLRLSPDGTALLFQDKVDGRLYRLQLP